MSARRSAAQFNSPEDKSPVSSRSPSASPLSNEGSPRSPSAVRAKSQGGSVGRPHAVTVCVRIRPHNARELDRRAVMRMGAKEVTLLDPKQGFGDKEHLQYDLVLDSTDPASASHGSQADVYNSLGPGILDHAFQGYNTCVFCYGQTGAGKTHTMMGDPSSSLGPSSPGDAACGLMPRLAQDLFSRITKAAGGSTTGATRSFQVQVSYLEMYCEKVRDLLDPQAHPPGSRATMPMPQPPRDLRVRNNPKATPACLLLVETCALCTSALAGLPTDQEGPVVEGLTWHLCESTRQVLQALEKGNAARATASTRMNEHSSRSHTSFTLLVQ
eukprot:gene4589-4803_t